MISKGNLIGNSFLTWEGATELIIRLQTDPLAQEDTEGALILVVDDKKVSSLFHSRFK